MAQYIETKQIAQRYANALLQASLDNNVLEVVIADVRKIRDVLLCSEELQTVVGNISLSKDVVKSVMTDILQCMEINDYVVNTVRLLCNNRRIFALIEVLNIFDELYKKHKGIVQVEVISVAELGCEDKSILTTKLKNVVQSNIEVQYRVKPTIIGGLIVKFESKMIDSSVQTQLQRLTPVSYTHLRAHETPEPSRMPSSA